MDDDLDIYSGLQSVSAAAPAPAPTAYAGSAAAPVGQGAPAQQSYGRAQGGVAHIQQQAVPRAAGHAGGAGPQQYQRPSVFSGPTEVVPEGKIFVGGIPWAAQEDDLRQTFEKYGVLEMVKIVRDFNTGRSRGFGFVTFMDATVVGQVLGTDHYVQGRRVDLRKAVKKGQEAMTTTHRKTFRENPEHSRNKQPYAGGHSVGMQRGPMQSRANDDQFKVFVGGIPQGLDEPALRAYFEHFGEVTDAVLMLDRETGRSRGFGFVTFAEGDTIAKVLQQRHQMHGKTVEIKKAEPRGSTHIPVTTTKSANRVVPGGSGPARPAASYGSLYGSMYGKTGGFGGGGAGAGAPASRGGWSTSLVPAPPPAAHGAPAAQAPPPSGGTSQERQDAPPPGQSETSSGAGDGDDGDQDARFRRRSRSRSRSRSPGARDTNTDRRQPPEANDQYPRYRDRDRDRDRGHDVDRHYRGPPKRPYRHHGDDYRGRPPPRHDDYRGRGYDDYRGRPPPGDRDGYRDGYRGRHRGGHRGRRR